MRAALSRFTDPRVAAPGDQKVLFVLTDGQSTDGDPRLIAARCKESGISVYSCFVADTDVVASKHLFGQAQDNWTDPAAVMHDVASAVGPGNRTVQLLREYGWHADDGCKLFAQVNHSEVLSQFTRSILRSVVDLDDDPVDGG